MAQKTQYHLIACPSNNSGLLEDCSCREEVTHYLSLAKLSFGLFVFEFIGGLFSGSMALISDSLHVLLDGAENIVSAIVSKFSQKHDNEALLRKIGGKVSALLLLIAGAVIIYEGWERILAPRKVEWYMTIIALIGLFVNLWQMNLHRKALEEHHNQTHSWQNWHLVSDIAASVAVFAGGVIMFIANGLYWIDGFLSVSIGILIVIFTSARLIGFELHSHQHDHHEHNHRIECNHKH